MWGVRLDSRCMYTGVMLVDVGGILVPGIDVGGRCERVC